MVMKLTPNIRRFQTGVSEKPVAGAVSVRNIVKDSSNKIFIGGISKIATSEMLMEIAGAFGPLKACHFEDNSCLGSPCAFVEGNHGDQDQPFYGTPVHAQPLLEKPTQVLKLNNVVDPHSLPSLSESELDEILEDIRLECARFGMVKSINIIKQTDSPEIIKVAKEADTMVDEVTEPSGEISAMADSPENVNGAVGPIIIPRNEHENKNMKNETEDTMAESPVKNQNLEENSNQISYEIDQLELNDSIPTDDENKTLEAELHDTPKDYLSESNINFEVGSVLVEYKRTEASSMAAPCLHGRVFDRRTMTVEYVAHDVYCSRFCK